MSIKSLLAALVVSLVLVNTHAHDIADAGQFKPGIKTPRIKVRPPVIKPRITVIKPRIKVRPPCAFSWYSLLGAWYGPPRAGQVRVLAISSLDS